MKPKRRRWKQRPGRKPPPRESVGADGGVSYDEIARRLGMSKGTVQNIAARALAKMAAVLAEDEIAADDLIESRKAG